MRKVIYIIVVLIFTLGIFFFHHVIGFPLIIGDFKLSQEIEKHEIGDSVKIFDSYDFDSDSWCCYLLFYKDDVDKSKQSLSGKLYKTKDTKLLKQIQKDWVFKCTGADISTVNSKILLYKNGKLVYKSSIVLEKEFEGIQTIQCGWVQSDKSDLLNRHCKQFKRVYSPIVFL